MMDTAQPGFEIGKYEIIDGQKLSRNLRIALLRHGHVVIAMTGEVGEAAPVNGDDSGTRCHGALDEAAERSGATVWNQCQPHTAGVASVPPLVEATVGTFGLAD